VPGSHPLLVGARFLAIILSYFAIYLTAKASHMVVTRASLGMIFSNSF
jgi:hypothetical protein